MKEMENVKQVIVIRKDLKMRRGKEIAQGAHASIAFMTNRLTSQRRMKHGLQNDAHVCSHAAFSPAEVAWMDGSFRKICCVVTSEEELLTLIEKAKEAGVTCELIQDAGYTEFDGVPTYTAAAFGPDYDENLDPITGDLVLY